MTSFKSALCPAAALSSEEHPHGTAGALTTTCQRGSNPAPLLRLVTAPQLWLLRPQQAEGGACARPGPWCIRMSYIPTHPREIWRALWCSGESKAQQDKDHGKEKEKTACSFCLGQAGPAGSLWVCPTLTLPASCPSTWSPLLLIPMTPHLLSPWFSFSTGSEHAPVPATPRRPSVGLSIGAGLCGTH